MKTPVCLIALLLAGSLALAAEPPAATDPPRLQAARYDLDQNGSLDQAERRAYRQARFEWRRELARSRAANRPALTPEMKELVEPQVWTEEKRARYDVNGNGRIEPPESGRERIAAMQAAQARFRELDVNRDGHLDAQERQAGGLGSPPTPPPSPGNRP